MNLGAHIVVAQRRLDNDPAYWLGSALPDIASMGGFRLLGSTQHDRVTAGIAFHHRTDEAFHHHAWFNSIQFPLREALLDAGFSRGPARAIAHVGPELLLDGWLLGAGADAIDAAFDVLGSLRDQLTPLVLPEHRDRWSTHLDRASDWRPGHDAHDHHAVARRLHRILERRARLGFDVSQIGEAARLLETVNQHIGDTAADFIDELSAQLDRS